jgi:outer membrane lipoprotein-sorting protein
MNFSRCAVVVTFVFFSLLIGACTGVRPKPELPVVVVKDVLELLDKTREKNPIHDTLRGQARISVSSTKDNYRATEIVFSKKPSFLRLETIGPIGETLLFLTTDLKRVFIYSPMENRFYTGLASKKNLSLLIPLPFRAAEIVGLLQGRMDLTSYSAKGMTFDGLAGTYEITVLPEEPATGMAVLTIDGRTFSILEMRLYDADNNLIVDGAFDDFTEIGGGTLPMTLSYKVPDEGTFVTVGITYNDIEVDTPVDDSRFSLEPPRGVQEIDLDKSIINFNRTPIQ